MESTYTYDYVPYYIVRNWADKAGKVKYNAAFESVIYTSDAREMYLENLTNNHSLDAEGSDYFTYAPLVEAVLKLSRGDSTPFRGNLFEIATFLMFCYYTDPVGYGCLSSIMLEELLRVEDLSSISKEEREVIADRAKERLRETRDVEKLLKAQGEAFMMAPYIMDLKPVVVEAGSPMGFFLSASPLFFGNPYNKYAFNDIPEPYSRRGAVFFMPLSPRFAICLYDGDIYKVNKTEGRVFLTEEDTSLINSYTINAADDVCFTCSEEEYMSFKEKNFKGLYEVNSFNPSFLKVKNKLPEDKDAKREIVELMTSYDNDALGRMEEPKVITQEFHQKRMKYLYSILGSITNPV